MKDLEKIEPIEQDKAKIKTVINEPIPTIYCDGFMGISYTDNIVKMNLVDERMPEHGADIYRYVVARLAMPRDVFENFVDILYKIKEKAKAQKEQDQKSAGEDA